MEKIIVITSLYKSEATIEEFYKRSKETINAIKLDYEFIFVNDGSPDDSTLVVEKLISQDDKITLLNLSRNFGQYLAMFAGIKYALNTPSEYVYICDSDLEEAPENIKHFYEQIQAQPKVDVVYGVVEERTGSFVKKELGKLFFDFLGYMSSYNIPKNQAWARLMKRNYFESLASYTEVESYPAGLMHITGYNQISYTIQKPYKGSTSYSFIKRIYSAVSAFTSFSSEILLYVSLIGFFIFSISTIFIIYIVIRKIMYPEIAAGWSSLMASIWFMGGLITFCLGITGIYISKIFNQIKNRPLYIIKSVIKQNILK